MRYVALGDSYTIGTSVGKAERWPNQLVAGLGARVPPTAVELVANLGVNGFTSADVIRTELPALPGLRPEVVSLLVGVNDVIRGVSAGAYEANVGRILEAAIELVGAGRTFGLTTPDYTVTPAGADYGNPIAVAARIREFNAVFTAAAEAHHVAVVDIHDLSLRAAADRSLVARDGLHPSGAQYALWVERIAPLVEAMARLPG